MSSDDTVLAVITNAGNVFGSAILNTNLGEIFQFSGAKIGFNPQDRFMVSLGTGLAVITDNGSVFKADIANCSTELLPVFQFSGAAIGFNPQDRFMVSMVDANYLAVITSVGDVFAAEVEDQSIGPVFQLPGAKIGFNPQDRFMVSLDLTNSTDRTLVVITQSGDVFGAPIQGRDGALGFVPQSLGPVFQFSGAKIGFNPVDKFMVAIGNTLVVITQTGAVFGANVNGRNIDPVFQFSGAAIGFNPQDRFMMAVNLSCIE